MSKPKLKLVTFDTETDGVDTDNCRIITCFMRAKDGDEVVFERNWVLDPGVEIPEEASDVHGMTTEWIRGNGRKNVAEAIKEISENLIKFAKEGFIVTGYNNSFDLKILEAEVLRHTDYPLPWAVQKVRFLDPVHFSRKFDKFKKGGHKLIDVAKRQGLEIEDDRLHAADYDVEVTEKLVPIFLSRAWREMKYSVKGKTPDQFIDDLQELQDNWNREWAEGITEYFAKTDKRDDDGNLVVVEASFPY